MICFYRSIRVAAAEQFLIMSSLGTTHQFLQLCIVLLFSVLHTHVIEYASNSHEYFQVIIFNLNQNLCHNNLSIQFIFYQSTYRSCHTQTSCYQYKYYFSNQRFYTELTLLKDRVGYLSHQSNIKKTQILLLLERKVTRDVLIPQFLDSELNSKIKYSILNSGVNQILKKLKTF